MANFASIDDLKARLDWVLDEDEERAANGALEDASDLARFYGKDWEDAASSPRLVRTLVLVCVKRYMTNPSGYVQSRAGDETLGMTDLGDKAGGIYFTEAEQQMLFSLAGRTKLYSAPLTAYGPMRRRHEGYVPVEDGSKPFPMYRSDTSPW